MRFLVQFILFLMEIILPSGLKPCVVISKAASCGFYVSCNRPIPEQVDKETDFAYVIRIEDWESANHQIITWFRNTFISSIVDEFGNIDTAKEVWTYLLLGMLDRVVLATSSSHANFIRFVRNQVSESMYITIG